MNVRLNSSDLQTELKSWDDAVPGPVLLVACGGTALTLYGYKESTKDVDFIVPVASEYTRITSVLKKLGYIEGGTAYGFRHPINPWIIELSCGQSIFNLCELLDPLQEKENHRVMQQLKRITVACLNPMDLVISKIFRGTQVDVDDSLIMIRSETIDLKSLTERYIETAGYDTNPTKCKTNLGFLVSDLELYGFDVNIMKELMDKWTP